MIVDMVVGMASTRKRLLRSKIGHIVAVGVALLLAPVSAQSSVLAFTPPDTKSEAPGPYGKIGIIAPNASSLRFPNVEPFELSVTPLVQDGPFVHTWHGIQAGMHADLGNLARCRALSQACSAAALKFNKIVAEARSLSGLARIGVINRAVNLAIKPVAGGDPYVWRSPLDALSAGEGDCKDYAVAKYLALLEAGFGEEDVKLVIVHDVKLNQDHAIVAVHFDGDWIMLDNRWLALVRDVEIRRAIPLYVLDGNGVSRFGRHTLR